MYINSFNHFRAVSILLIIAGHCLYAPLGLEFDTIFEKTVKNLLTGGTYLFVFISGFLFHHIFFQKYHFIFFFTKKLVDVFIPYLILGLAPVTWYILSRSGWYGGYFLPSGTGMVDEYIFPALKYYMSGRFLFAYWYIPFIITIFLSSPLHVLYVRLNLHLQIFIIFAFSTIAIFIHRPVNNINLLQSVIYFTPIYLIGITTSIKKEDIYILLEGKEIYLLFIVVLLSVFQTFTGVESNYHKSAFEYGGVDLMFFQKISLCFLLMVWLHRFENYKHGNIQIIAETSFALFFIHPFVLEFFGRLELDFLRADSWTIYFLFVIAVTFTCVLTAKLFKRVLRKYSRYLIGY